MFFLYILKFLLEQINSDNNEEWKAWNQNLDQYLSRGIWPHLGGIAARNISKEVYLLGLNKI